MEHNRRKEPTPGPYGAIPCERAVCNGITGAEETEETRRQSSHSQSPENPPQSVTSQLAPSQHGQDSEYMPDTEEHALDLSLPNRARQREHFGIVMESDTSPDREEEPEPEVQLGKDFIVIDQVPKESTPVQDELDLSWGIPEEGELVSCPGSPAPADAPWNISFSGGDVEPLPGLSAAQLVQRIVSEGIPQGELEEWMLKKRGYSLHVFHDGVLKNWPVARDTKCALVSREADATVQQWSRFVRSGELRLRGHSVVLMLETLRRFTTSGQLKNAIANLVRSIRAVAREERRVYVCNPLPTISPERGLGMRLQKYNQLLQESIQALRVSHDLSKVFFVDMGQYFQPSEQPLGEWLNLSGVLTKTACIHFRAHLFREVGITGQ